MKLVNVYSGDPEEMYENARALYAILDERTPEQSISHKGMPSWDEHVNFVDSRPYGAWYLIEVDGRYVGATYLTKDREIGLFILRAEHRKGYGKQALSMLRELHPGHLLANVNPDNIPSRIFWETLGGDMIQVTYRLE